MDKPWKPINAIERSDAVISANGNPSKGLGHSAVTARRSRTDAKRIIARVKPTPDIKPLRSEPIKLYPLLTLRRATPRTAQLVVIRGR